MPFPRLLLIHILIYARTRVCIFAVTYSLPATCCMDGGEREGVGDYISNRNLAGLMYERADKALDIGINGLATLRVLRTDVTLYA